MDIKIDISPEAINKAVSDAVLQSAIGKELHAGIESAIKSLDGRGGTYQTAIRKAIEGEMLRIIRDTIRNEHAEMIAAKMREFITDEILNDVIKAAWDTMLEKFDVIERNSRM